MDAIAQCYQGFEQGSIRPPSEAHSLLIRVTRNCPWNHCTFCPVYKETNFSLRPVDDVKRDINSVFRHIEKLKRIVDPSRNIPTVALKRLHLNMPEEERLSFNAALNWFVGGMQAVFLQDANSLVIKPAQLIEILEHLKMRFPHVQRITSYARSKTLVKMKDSDLKAIKEAGLNRVHIGLESGSDKVLAYTKKGVTKAEQITAGIKVKNAGMELSEYFMPGLGGQEYSAEHALESADALSQINPDFIRLRTLAIPEESTLFEAWQSGEFKKCSEVQIIQEITQLLEHLEGITSKVKSDHVLNLFPLLEGKLPEDKDNMLNVLYNFLQASPERQFLYQVGRRCGFVSQFSDLDQPSVYAHAQTVCKELGIDAENVDTLTDELMRQFIAPKLTFAKE
jgi:radical SAM superfamily enzyme YgiQ (UPF0313 family)